ncbi:MAG TPA: hypothetical protein VGL64_05610 [Amycolatopsis sp.]
MRASTSTSRRTRLGGGFGQSAGEQACQFGLDHLLDGIEQQLKRSRGPGRAR